jgi:hypothetical protein
MFIRELHSREANKYVCAPAAGIAPAFDQPRAGIAPASTHRYTMAHWNIRMKREWGGRGSAFREIAFRHTCDLNPKP